MKKVFLALYPQSENRWTNCIDDNQPQKRAAAFVALLKEKKTRKGDFAQQLAELIEAGEVCSRLSRPGHTQGRRTMTGMTDEQRSFANHVPEAFVEACPARARHGQLWRGLSAFPATLPPRRGLAVLSFTNAAIEEFVIRCQALGLESALRHSGFVGTFDAFLSNSSSLPAELMESSAARWWSIAGRRSEWTFGDVAQTRSVVTASGSTCLMPRQMRLIRFHRLLPDCGRMSSVTRTLISKLPEGVGAPCGRAAISVRPMSELRSCCGFGAPGGQLPWGRCLPRDFRKL